MVFVVCTGEEIAVACADAAPSAKWVFLSASASDADVIDDFVDVIDDSGLSLLLLIFMDRDWGRDTLSQFTEIIIESKSTNRQH